MPPDTEPHTSEHPQPPARRYTVAQAGRGILWVCALCGALAGGYAFLEEDIGTSAALAQDVEDNTTAIAAETATRSAEDAKLTSDVAKVSDDVAAVQVEQASVAATLDAVQSDIEDIKAGQDRQLELLIQIASEGD
jgi:hypothetical protein